MTSISVVVGTYGDYDKWFPLACDAAKSAVRQTMSATDVQCIHRDTLAEARNAGAESAKGDYLVFLDADDELDPNYLRAMSKAAEEPFLRSDYPTYLFRPATLGVVNGVSDPEPVVLPERPLQTGNFMVIGTMVERSLFLEVGGFREWEAYEDWDLWCRCWKAGAGFAEVPEAIYRVHVNPKGRNSLDRKEAGKLFHKIRSENFGSPA